MQKKIVLIDVDGTLVDYEGKLPNSATKAIRMARANGHKVYNRLFRQRKNLLVLLPAGEQNVWCGAGICSDSSHWNS